MRFYKNIGVFITIVTLIVIALNVFFYTSFYNQQIKAHSLIISKQAKLCANQIEDNINDFQNDLNFYFNKYDFRQLFNERNIQSEPVRKLRQFFIKYNDLISSIEITDNNGNNFIFNGNSDNYFNKSYNENKEHHFSDKNLSTYISDNQILYTSVLKDGNDIIANLNVKIELGKYINNIFRQYHVSDQYFQSLMNNQGEIIYNNLSDSVIQFSNQNQIKKSINQNYEGLFNQKIIYNNKDERIITGIYPINILDFRYGLIFSENKSTIYDFVIRKTGLISLFTILTFIIIIIIFLGLVKSLKNNEIILKQKNQDLEQLTFSASHHLQEPLRKIYIFSDRLQSSINSDNNESVIKTIEKIQGYTLTMRQMLNGLLLLSEINIKNNQFEKLNINDIITEITNEYSINKINKETLIIEDLPEITGNFNLIKIMIKQILDNCINFAKKDIPLKIEILNGKKQKKYYQIIIKDNGQGFDKKYSELIFQPFQQLSVIEGSNRYGIGLSIASKIIEKHKGKILAISEPDNGCIIQIDFYKNLKNE